jgi:hypothetical protein
MDEALQRHGEMAAEIQAELLAIEERAQAEEARWRKEKSRLEVALRRARG